MILGIAITAHAVLAQLMYAGAFVRVDVPPAELRGAADLMYYGGDIAELLLALAMVSTWRPRRRPRIRPEGEIHGRRRGVTRWSRRPTGVTREPPAAPNGRCRFA